MTYQNSQQPHRIIPTDHYYLLEPGISEHYEIFQDRLCSLGFTGNSYQTNDGIIELFTKEPKDSDWVTVLIRRNNYVDVYGYDVVPEYN
jgi:hypothetical protein